jgi:hypothetical protein
MALRKRYGNRLNRFECIVIMRNPLLSSAFPDFAAPRSKIAFTAWSADTSGDSASASVATADGAP